MQNINDKLNFIRQKTKSEKIKIMIIGLGSVGNYLLDYLLSSVNPEIDLCVVGRCINRLQSDVNINTVAALIRGQNRNHISIIDNVNLDNVDTIVSCIDTYAPDIIVNSSRAYSGLKYGSISWKTVRAYGIWTPLSIKYIRNIMLAYERSHSNAIVINTSYSDATIPWLKSAGMYYPDFGSGNLNHLIPRIKLAVSEMMHIEDYWNIDVTLATSHFHDVVISKEGHTENCNPLLSIKYGDKDLNLNHKEIFSKCKIPMPVDSKRNMMNASSNFEIIDGIIRAVKGHEKIKLHCPGVFGEIGGYPVQLDGNSNVPKAYIDNSIFSIDDMRRKNRESIYLDGIENIANGALIYTDELLNKVYRCFAVKLPKIVEFDRIDDIADLLIDKIILKYKES